MNRRKWLGGIWVGLTAVGTGCLPFVTPPARVSVGPAAHVDALPGTSREDSEQGFMAVRAAAHPLDLVDRPENNRFDLGLGYQAEFPSAENSEVATVHGPYLELGAYPLLAPLGSSLVLRGGAYGTVATLFREDVPRPGLGGSLGALIEVSGGAGGVFADAGSDGSVIAGVARGRWGVGLWGSGSLQDFSDGAYRGVAAGVSVRVPLLAGVVCCAWPDLGRHSSSGSSRRSSSASWRLRREPAHPRRKQ